MHASIFSILPTATMDNTSKVEIINLVILQCEVVRSPAKLYNVSVVCIKGGL